MEYLPEGKLYDTPPDFSFLSAEPTYLAVILPLNLETKSNSYSFPSFDSRPIILISLLIIQSIGVIQMNIENK